MVWHNGSMVVLYKMASHQRARILLGWMTVHMSELHLRHHGI